MNKTKSRSRTRITDIAVSGPRLIDDQLLRLVTGGLVKDGTCAPGKTYPGSYTNPGERDTITDDVFD